MTFVKLLLKIRQKIIVNIFRVGFCVGALLLIGVLQFLQNFLPTLEAFHNTSNSIASLKDGIGIALAFNEINYYFWFYRFLHALFGTISLTTVRVIFYLLQTIVLLGFFSLFFYTRCKFLMVALLLILIGGTSNLLTRIWNHHTVIDYFFIKVLPNETLFFNIEDVLIGTGILLIIVYLPFIIWRESSQ